MMGKWGVEMMGGCGDEGMVGVEEMMGGCGWGCGDDGRVGWIRMMGGCRDDGRVGC